MSAEEETAATATNESAVETHSPSTHNQNLKNMRLEGASFRLTENASTSGSIEPENSVVLNLALTDVATRSNSEHVDLVLSQGEVYKLLMNLRGMSNTISSLSGQQASE